MAVKKKTTGQANGPHSAPHTAASPPPAPSAAPPANGPAAAVWAALTANPGAGATQIADAAGTSRIIAGRELAALEASGLATRTPAARKGCTTTPATWHPAPQPATPAPSGPDQAPAASPPGTTASPAPAAGAGRLPAPGGGAPDEAGSSAPETGDAGLGNAARAQADGGTPGEHAGPPAAGTLHAGAADAPAAAGAAAALLRGLASAATSAAEVLDGGDTAAALAEMDTIRDGAAQARRLLKAAAIGRKPRGTSPAARPGQLRDLVAAHLAANPAAEFTPHAIGRVLGRSSGAVANALDRLTALGQARLTTDKPRRYQNQAAASSTPAPAETA
ncbi:MAG TPA: hypothetical protein VMV92_00570 [Streptosporangiaceae bacterium]|nr:hypothetical protein [Streptosporangiaceae bacterium]